MKKFILVLIVCLYAGNVKAEKSFDVDMLYDSCTKHEFSTGWEFCLGYIRGVSEGYYRNAPYSYKQRCSVKNFRDIIDRFVIMYKRDRFDIGSDAYGAIIQSIVDLCPLNDEEKSILWNKINADPYIKSLFEKINNYKDDEKNP